MAERISRLGTETAFAVSAGADAWKALCHPSTPSTSATARERLGRLKEWAQ